MVRQAREALAIVSDLLAVWLGLPLVVGGVITVLAYLASFPWPLTLGLAMIGFGLAAVVATGLGRRRDRDVLRQAQRPSSTRPGTRSWEALRDELTRERGLLREHYTEVETIIGPHPGRLAISISGTVTSEGKPVKDACITVGPPIRCAAMTGEDGTYFLPFPGITPAGIGWDVRCLLAGKIRGERLNVILNGPTTVDFELDSEGAGSSAPSRKPEAARILVPANVTAEYLLGLFKGHTRIQAEKLVEPFAGKWMKLSGTVDQVSSNSVTLMETKTLNNALGNGLWLYFDRSWYDRLAVLTAGTPITVIGQIDQIHGAWVDLRHCEIVEA